MKMRIINIETMSNTQSSNLKEKPKNRETRHIKPIPLILR
jgi:hypothetical protein